MDCAGFNMMIQYNMAKFMRLVDDPFTPNNFCTDGKVGAYDPVGSLKYVTNQGSTTLRSTLNDYLADSTMYYVEKNLTGGTGFLLYQHPANRRCRCYQVHREERQNC